MTLRTALLVHGAAVSKAFLVQTKIIDDSGRDLLYTPGLGPLFKVYFNDQQILG